MTDRILEPLYNYILLQRMEKFDRMSLPELYDLFIEQKRLDQESEPASQEKKLAYYTWYHAEIAFKERYKFIAGGQKNDTDPIKPV